MEIKWKTRSDKVLYFENDGLTYAYFIYPPKYDHDDQNLPILSIIDINGRVLSEHIFNSAEKAKIKANKHLNSLLHKINNFSKTLN